jgi:aminopeptidase N
MEYPRYRSFAQSFPTVIPFAESLGFILDVDDSKDVDMPFYVTSHAVSHQWWGLHLVAGNVKGKNFIVETLAQYSALMVLEGNYGLGKVRQLLSFFEERYLEGRRADQKPEKPLIQLEKEEYLYYYKGAMAMYELKSRIGEEAVNGALKAFLADWNIETGSRAKVGFPTTSDLLTYFKKEMGDSDKEVVKELFEEVWVPDVGRYN